MNRGDCPAGAASGVLVAPRRRPAPRAPPLPDLLPTFRTILERKSLSVAGAKTPEQVDWLRRALPTGCLAICT